jgi:hypothetical protein
MRLMNGYDERRAMTEGWLLCDNSDYGVQIEYWGEDPNEYFTSDEDALAFVETQATKGDKHAAFCLAVVAEFHREHVYHYLCGGLITPSGECCHCAWDAA